MKTKPTNQLFIKKIMITIEKEYILEDLIEAVMGIS